MYGLAIVAYAISMIIPSIGRIVELYNRKMTELGRHDVCPTPPAVAMENSKVLQQAWRCFPNPAKEHYSAGTVCTSTCVAGGRPKAGTSARIACYKKASDASSVAHWNAEPLECVPTDCDTSEINPVENGKWSPEKCMLQRVVEVGTRCTLECHRFYTREFSAAGTTTCRTDGWSNRRSRFSCTLRQGLGPATERSTPIHVWEEHHHDSLVHHNRPTQHVELSKPDTGVPAAHEVLIKVPERPAWTTVSPARWPSTIKIKQGKAGAGAQTDASGRGDKEKQDADLLQRIKGIVETTSITVLAIVSASVVVAVIAMVTGCCYFLCRSRRHRYVLVNSSEECTSSMSNANNNRAGNNNSCGEDNTPVREWVMPAPVETRCVCHHHTTNVKCHCRRPVVYCNGESSDSSSSDDRRHHHRHTQRHHRHKHRRQCSSERGQCCSR